MPLKMRLTLKLLAGQILPEALQRVGFRLQYSFKLLYLNLDMAFNLCWAEQTYLKNTSWTQSRPGSRRIAPYSDWSVKLSKGVLPSSCPSSALQYWLSLPSVFLSRSIWQEHTNFFRLFAPYSVSLFIPSVHYSVNRCLVTLGSGFTVNFLSIETDFGGDTHLSLTELSWVVAYLTVKQSVSLFCKEAPIPADTLGTMCAWG